MLKNKKRHICYWCKAKKYQKYMRICARNGLISKITWECLNGEKCKIRGANYKK